MLTVGGGDVDDILDAIANGREVGGLDVDKDVPLGLQTKVPNINLYTRVCATVYCYVHYTKKVCTLLVALVL